VEVSNYRGDYSCTIVILKIQMNVFKILFLLYLFVHLTSIALSHMKLRTLVDHSKASNFSENPYSIFEVIINFSQKALTIFNPSTGKITD